MKGLVTYTPYFILIDFADASLQLEVYTNVSKYTLGGALLTIWMEVYIQWPFIANNSVQKTVTIVHLIENCLQ